MQTAVIVEQGMLGQGQDALGRMKNFKHFLLLLLHFVTVGTTSATEAVLIRQKSAQLPLLHDTLLLG